MLQTRNKNNLVSTGGFSGKLVALLKLVYMTERPSHAKSGETGVA